MRRTFKCPGSEHDRAAGFFMSPDLAYHQIQHQWPRDVAQTLSSPSQLSFLIGLEPPKEGKDLPWMSTTMASRTDLRLLSTLVFKISPTCKRCGLAKKEHSKIALLYPGQQFDAFPCFLHHDVHSTDGHFLVHSRINQACNQPYGNQNHHHQCKHAIWL